MKTAGVGGEVLAVVVVGAVVGTLTKGGICFVKEGSESKGLENGKGVLVSWEGLVEEGEDEDAAVGGEEMEGWWAFFFPMKGFALGLNLWEVMLGRWDCIVGMGGVAVVGGGK